MKLLYPLAKRFIAGHDLRSAAPNINNLIDQGYDVSVDYVGENCKNKEDCLKAYKQYVRIIKFFKNKKIDISIKPSQLGLNIHPILSYHYLSSLANRAKKYSHTIRLDMEDSSTTSNTINLAITLNKRFGNVGVAIQSNLYRSDEDIDNLIDKGVSVRIVKGAYKENKKIAHQTYFSISGCFFDYAARLYSNKANKPAIGTHDEELLEDVQQLIPKPEYFDYEFLYGIRRDLQKDLKDKGYNVRVYVPFGEDWLPYTLRRLKEWKNLKFVIKNIFNEIFRRRSS